MDNSFILLLARLITTMVIVAPLTHLLWDLVNILLPIAPKHKMVGALALEKVFMKVVAQFVPNNY